MRSRKTQVQLIVLYLIEVSDLYIDNNMPIWATDMVIIFIGWVVCRAIIDLIPFIRAHDVTNFVTTVIVLFIYVIVLFTRLFKLVLVKYKLIRKDNHMIIGITLDGVLTANEEFVEKFGSEYFKTEYDGTKLLSESNPFNVDALQWQQFTSSYKRAYEESAPINNGVKLWIKQQAGKDNIILIFSTRKDRPIYPDSDPSMVSKWLSKYGVEYSGIIFTNGDTEFLCQKLGIDVLLTDDMQVVSKMRQSCPNTICLVKETLYNKTRIKEYNDSFYVRTFKLGSDLPDNLRK